MALIKCSECGKEISSNAKNCPNCGNPVNKGEFHKELATAKKVAIFIIVLIILFIISIPIYKSYMRKVSEDVQKDIIQNTTLHNRR